MRKTFGRARVVLLTGVIAMIGSASLHASTIFNWSDTGSGFSAYGHLAADCIGGTCTATAGSGFFTFPAANLTDAPITLVPGSLSPTGLFFFDNLFFPSNSPGSFLDGAGLLFSVPTNPVGELNIWGNGVVNGDSTWVGVGGAYTLSDNSSDFQLNEAPEPLSLPLLGSGLIMLALIGRRRLSR